MKQLKRGMLLAASMLTGALLLTACSGGSAPAPAPEDTDKGEGTTEVTTVEEVKYGSWQPGPAAVSNMWTHFLAEDADLQEKHGLKFTNELYTNLEALYTDLSLGRVQGVSAGPSAMAQQATQGAPVRMVSTSARSTAAILSTGKEWSAEDLKGARLVAPTSTATWADVQGQIEEAFGLIPDRDYELVASKDLAGAVTQLAAGTADFAMSWGEYIPNALAEFDNVKVVADPEKLAQGGKIPWQFSISVHESVNDEAAKRLREAATEIVAWMQANPEAVEAFATGTGQKPGTATAMIEGAQTFEFLAIDDAVRAELELSFNRLIDMGRMEALPPETFYGK